MYTQAVLCHDLIKPINTDAMPLDAAPPASAEMSLAAVHIPGPERYNMIESTLCLC